MFSGLTNSLKNRTYYVPKVHRTRLSSKAVSRTRRKLRKLRKLR